MPWPARTRRAGLGARNIFVSLTGAAPTGPTSSWSGKLPLRRRLRTAQPKPWSPAGGELSPWSGAQTLLDKLQNVTKLAVVTNCSERLGVLAASRLGTRWDCIVTAERAGYYKPHSRPYLLALET